MDLNERQIHRTREGEMGKFLKSSGMCKKVYMDITVDITVGCEDIIQSCYGKELKPFLRYCRVKQTENNTVEERGRRNQMFLKMANTQGLLVLPFCCHLLPSPSPSPSPSPTVFLWYFVMTCQTVPLCFLDHLSAKFF